LRAGSSCRGRCLDVYDASCVEEREDANACSALARPIFDQERTCTQSCDAQKEAGLEGYNRNCPGGHGGDKGVTITFVNTTEQTRYYDRPGSLPRGTIAPGESYTVELACGVDWDADFYDSPSDPLYIERHAIPPFPCCEEPAEQTLPLDWQQD
jgi:hypothetical protein